MNQHWALKFGYAVAIATVGALLFWFAGVLPGFAVTLPLALAYFWFMGYRNLFLAVLGGALAGVAWPATGDLTPLLLICWVPLLFAEHNISERFKGKTGSGSKVFGAAYLFFLTFSCVSTWWIYYASAGGLIMAVGLNSLFMAIVFRLFHGTKRALGNSAGYFSLFIYWVGFEYLHTFWDFSYPWLNFGNGLANQPELVQWYEITGITGGTVWILGLNVLAFFIIKGYLQGRTIAAQKNRIIGWFLLLMIPVGASLIRFYTYDEKGDTVEIVAVQPNIDPYNAKFQGDPKEHLEMMLALADEAMTPQTNAVLFPETALQEGFVIRGYDVDGRPQLTGLWEESLESSYSVNRIRGFLEAHPNTAMLTGMSSARVFKPGQQRTETARSLDDKYYYDAFNSALYMQKDSASASYRKSKLLIGVERMPLTWLLKYIEDWIWQMGGTTGSLGDQEERSVFVQQSSGLKMAPVICYESVYGEFVGEYVNQGANMLAIITNDGWWDDTPGYKQHKLYGALRAIEHRRSIARSANTGTSCFVDQRGIISQETQWWVKDAIRGEVTLNENLTFFTKYGDSLGRMMLFISIFVWLWSVVTRFRQKNSLTQR